MVTIPRTISDVVEASFSDSDLVAGCGLTFDDNFLHKPAQMRVLGYRAIVPGMLTTTRAFGIASPFLKDSFSADIYFGAALSSGEVALFSVYPDGDVITLSAPKRDEPSTDLFVHKDEKSVIGHYSPGYFPSRITNFSTITDSAVSEYSRIIRCGPDLASLWLAVARSSKALFELLSSPNSSLEEELAKRMPPNFLKPYSGKELPVYTALHINVAQPHVEPGIISYRATVAEKLTKRVYLFDVACVQNDRTILTGRYELALIPIEVILGKMAMPV